MQEDERTIPITLKPHFQEYDLEAIDLKRDVDLVLQRTLEFGNWEEIRWLFKLCGRRRIHQFVREHGERWLSPVAFNYWRKLLGVRKWTPAPFEKVMQWPP